MGLLIHIIVEHFILRLIGSLFRRSTSHTIMHALRVLDNNKKQINKKPFKGKFKIY